MCLHEIYRYQNDCNTCYCSDEGDACTEMGCDPDNPIENRCLSCIDGYELNEDNECKPDNSSCLYDNCLRFTDGCNGCLCTDDGEVYNCTNVLCVWQGIPACLECAEGYELNDNDECEEESTTGSCSDNCARYVCWFICCI